jgi:hypothetical protein
MADQTPHITFSLFVLSLSASAEIHLGRLPVPGTDTPAEPNPREAAHLIEVLAMLKEKTEGNLDESEEQLLEAVLFDLRMEYVALTTGEKRAVKP